MKNTYILLFSMLIISPFFANAQDMFKDNPSWTFRHNSFCRGGFIFWESLADTQIQGVDFKHIRRRYRLYDQCLNQEREIASSPAFLREEGGVVLAYTMFLMSYDTLYNFNLDSGEYYTYEDEYVATIKGKGVDSSNTLFPDWQIVEYKFENGFTYTDTVLKNLGNSKQYILPTDLFRSQVDGQQGGEFVCYANDLGEFSPGLSGTNCGALITKLDDLTTIDKPNLYYLNQSKRILITNPLEIPTELYIYDFKGTLAFRGSNIKEKSLDHFSPGLYSAVLEYSTSGEKNRIFWKFIR
ncbi:MAG: hypothetical protein MRZ79_11695 [Bacteroidia bacterium]|nr:hypothetical protein [Bacteroidia bacterium]